MDDAPDRAGMEGYQQRGFAWDPFREDVATLLETGRHSDTQPIYYGSNHTFLVTVDAGEEGQSLAIYKPARGEYPLYDFAHGSLYKREISSWLVDSLLDWRLVPPTVEAVGDFGIGSVQLFIESHAGGEVSLRQLRRLVLLDIVLNNADRKAEHCLLGQDNRLWGIDHGLTFHVQPKLRTVLWHFSGSRIAQDDQEDLQRVHAALVECKEARVQQLSRMLSLGEWRALVNRVRRLVETRHFPDPRYKPMPYRW